MELKRFFSLIILSLLVCFLTLQAEGQKVKKVVIDAGHGGHDPGAVGKISKEKDIVLSIALKTGKFIEENIPDVEVIYTRKTDVFVELHRRAKIANEAKADLFISIHCNANKSTTPYGAETYVMGLHKSDANLSVAQTENASILLEEDYHVKYDGFDPTSPEGYIFFSMLQNAYLDQSLGLASSVQKHFKDRVNLFDRGVKQAGFWVLYKTTMPAILIETGFISNVKEEKMLASDEGQTYIASAIFRAVKEYKQTVERTPATIVKNESTKPAPSSQDKVANGSSTTAKTNPVTTEKPLLAQNDASINTIADNNPAATQPAITNTVLIEPAGNAGKEFEKPYEQSVVFKVQFLVSRSLHNSTAGEFRGLKSVDHYVQDGLYKYTYGNERTQEAASQLVKELNKIGFKDCFVVAFHNGERISISEANKILGN
jgi:N-acetylmuramoyl-L-alanine amidase